MTSSSGNEHNERRTFKKMGLLCTITLGHKLCECVCVIYTMWNTSEHETFYIFCPTDINMHSEFHLNMGLTIYDGERWGILSRKFNDRKTSPLKWSRFCCSSGRVSAPKSFSPNTSFKWSHCFAYGWWWMVWAKSGFHIENIDAECVLLARVRYLKPYKSQSYTLFSNV